MKLKIREKRMKSRQVENLVSKYLEGSIVQNVLFKNLNSTKDSQFVISCSLRAAITLTFSLVKTEYVKKFILN